MGNAESAGTTDEELTVESCSGEYKITTAVPEGYSNYTHCLRCYKLIWEFEMYGWVNGREANKYYEELLGPKIKQVCGINCEDIYEGLQGCDP